jgi:hypothetical protein
MTEYRELGSFDQAEIDAVGVGEDAVAIASGERVRLVSGTDRSAFEHDGAIADIALHDRIVVLSSNRLTAYTRDGAGVWNRTFEAPHAVATLPDEPLVGVLEPERLVAVDLETGQEAFAVERRRPGQPRDDRLVGIESGFVSATWSFLRCVDTAGEEAFDRNLNTAIRDVGCCDGVLVAALQNGQLKGIDIETGNQRWETELPVRQIAPYGARELLLNTEDGIKSIGPNGSIRSVGTLGAGEIYASRDGSVVCSVRNGTVVTYVPSEELIDVEIPTESVGVGGTVDVNVTNLGETTHDITLTASMEHADLSPDERRLKLAPREPTLTDFPVESVRTDGETAFTARIEGRIVAEGSIEVTDAAESTVTVEADLRPVEVENGVARLELSVENTGSVPLDSVSTLDPDERETDIGPGETWTTTITKPYEAGRTITVGIDVVRGNRRTELAPSCQLPEHPSVELRQERDALHGRIEADKAVAWSDELVVDVPGADRVRSPVRIEDGSLLVLLPVYESGIARVGLSSVDITDQARMTDEGPLADLTTTTRGGTDRSESGSGSGSSGGSGPGSGGRSGSERSATAGESSPRNEPDTNTAPESSPSSDQADRRNRDRTPREDRSPERSAGGRDEPSERSDRPAADERDGNDDTDGTDSAEGTLSVKRELSDRDVTVGHAVRERITVRNEGNAAEPTVAVGDDRLDPGVIDSGDAWRAERTVVFLTSDEAETQLPEVTLERDGEIVDRSPAERVPVSDRGLAVRAVVDPTDGHYGIELQNATDDEYRIDGLELDGRTADIGTPTVAAGERTSLEGTIRQSIDRRVETVEARIAATGREDGRKEIHTAAVVREGAGGGGGDPFRKTIAPSTQVAGEYGTVVLVFENETERDLSDVTLEADGEPINDMLYSAAHRETLPSGERIEHYVDLKTGAGTAEFDITATYADGSDTEASRTFRVTGPAVETEAEWTDDHRTSWSLEELSETGGDGTEFPPTVSTSFD